LVVERNCFLYNLAQLLEDSSFILAMAPTINQARRAPDKTLVLFPPFDDLRFSASVDEACAFKLGDKFSYLLRHEIPGGYFVA
jgi:hypothetical protein